MPVGELITMVLPRTPPPGVGTVIKSKQGDFFMRYDCLPDTVDPRGPKGK